MPSIFKISALSLLVAALAYGGQATALAQTDGLSIVTSDTGVVDGVGGGLLTLNRRIDGTLTPVEGPMVAVLSGSKGGYIQSDHPMVRDLLFAGFRVASMAYHGATGTPDHLREISIDAVANRIAELGRAAGVGEGCVGVLGVSKGAELTLLLASLSGVGDVHVAATPSDVVWQSSQTTFRRRSSWTRNGEPLPFVPYLRFSRATLTALRDVKRAGALHEASLRKADNLEAARIPIERATTPVLALAGSEDALWPTQAMMERMIARLDTDKPGHRVTLKSYPTGHYILRDAKARQDAIAFLEDSFAVTCTPKP